MKKLLKYTACLAILAMVVVLFTGCCGPWPGKVTGGGWFINTCRGNQGEKCTFGFNAQLKDNPGAVENEREYTGQFQFNDHNGTKVHISEITAYSVCMWGEITFKGKDKNDEDVNVRVTVQDNGEPGIGDEIEVRIGSKKYCGVLGGGNIQSHYKD